MSEQGRADTWEGEPGLPTSRTLGTGEKVVVTQNRKTKCG